MNCNVSITSTVDYGYPSNDFASEAKFTMEAYFSIEASKMFDGLVERPQFIIPKAAPTLIKEIDIISGDGGPGTIMKIYFPTDSDLKSVKLIVDAKDETNMTYAYTGVEGDTPMDNCEKIIYQISLETYPNIRQSKMLYAGRYIGEPGVVVNAEEIKVGEAKAIAVFQAVEEYYHSGHVINA